MALVTVQARGTKGFLEFVRKALPTTYRAIENELRASGQLSGLALTAPVTAAATEAPPSSSLVSTIKEIANVAAQAYLTREQIQSQQQILNVQLQRAQQGLPPLPIDPTTYGLPQPSIGIDLSSGTTKTILYVAGGIALAIALGLIGGGRASRR